MYTSCRRSLALTGFIIDSGCEGESSVVSVAHIMVYNTEFPILRQYICLTRTLSGRDVGALSHES